MANEQNSEASLPEQLRLLALGPEECRQCGRSRVQVWTCRGQFGCNYKPALDLSFTDKETLLAAANEIDDINAVFDLRWQADMRAIKMWQSANPGNDLIWPDHADLVVWLMSQVDGMRLVREDRDGA